MDKIQKAHKVRNFIEDESFKEAIAYLRAENVKKWQQSDTKDDEAQRDCKYIEYAINELLKQFKRIIDTGLIEEDKLKRLSKREQ